VEQPDEKSYQPVEKGVWNLADTFFNRLLRVALFQILNAFK